MSLTMYKLQIQIHNIYKNKTPVGQMSQPQ